MRHNKTIAKLKVGDKIYFFNYKKEIVKNDCSWEDESTPWNYIGSLGTKLTGSPYLGNIHEAIIYAPTEIRKDDAIIYVEYITKNGVHHKTGGIYIKKEDVKQTILNTPQKFVPEYNTVECDKFIHGTIVISTNKDECHVGWSAIWNEMFNAIDYEKCKLELWKNKLITWSDMERDKFFNELNS